MPRREASAGTRSWPMRERSSQPLNGSRRRTSSSSSGRRRRRGVQPDHQTAIVVLTHDDKFDEPALIGALETEAFYIGALGSRRNQERRRERLLEAGVDESALDRIMGPCGLDIGADTQEETALSILAEILAVRGQREGGFLKDAKKRIHVEVDSHSAGRLALGRARQVAPPHVGRRGGPRRHRHPWRSPLLPRGRGRAPQREACSAPARRPCRARRRSATPSLPGRE